MEPIKAWPRITEKELLDSLEPGDIFRTPGRGIPGWANSNLTAPKSRWFHYGLLWYRLGDDWVIMESTGSGVDVGLLSFYEGKDISFLRPDAPAELRHNAPEALIPYSRAKYDYLLFVKLLFGGLLAWGKMFLRRERLRALMAEEFPYAKNSAFICTEAVQIAYLAVGIQVIDAEVVPIPSAFEAAVMDGALIELGEIKGNV